MNLTGLSIRCGDSLLADNHYTYDGNGNRLEKQQLSGTTRYAYDALNQLVKAEYPTYGEEMFYDRAGNCTRRRTAGVEEVYAYDAGNHLLSHTKDGIKTVYEYDKAGNLLNDDRAAYSYDAFNRQMAVETFDGNIQINHYDAEGLRHEMEENGKLVQFIFQGTEVVVEETQEENIRYIRTHELLASDAESARTYYHYASDEMGSITHVTDEEGNLLNRYEYDAWGNLTLEDEQVPNRFKYTGEQFDPITQQYYLRARFYNPALARFMQEDTYRGDGLNLYAYCANNPVRYVDPSGHWCEKKEDIYRDLVEKNGLDINNIDPDTRQRLMAEAANEARRRRKAASSEGKHTPRLPGPVMTGQNRLLGPVADTPDDGRRGESGSNAGSGVKKVPNPNGKKGGAAHQSTIASIQPSRTGGTMNYEKRFVTPNGSKGCRYADAVDVVVGKVVAIHQVGKVNKNGTPVIRESQAIEDIMNAPDYDGAPIYFWPYNADSGPIIYDF